MCHGSGDLGATTVGALGVGCSAPAGGTYCYLGTSGWVATVRPQSDLTACRAFKVLAAHPSDTIVAAPTTTAGGNVAWLRKLLYPHLSSADAHAEIDAQARCMVACHVTSACHVASA